MNEEMNVSLLRLVNLMCAVATPLVRTGRSRWAGGGCTAPADADCACDCTKLLLQMLLLGPWSSSAVDFDLVVVSSTFTGADVAVVDLMAAACELAAAAAAATAATRDDASSIRLTITSCIALAAVSIARASHSASVRNWLTVDWWFLEPSAILSPSDNTIQCINQQKCFYIASLKAWTEGLNNVKYLYLKYLKSRERDIE